MTGLRLVRPTAAWADAILAYRQEFFDHGEERVNGSCNLHRCPDLAPWLEVVRAIEAERLSPDSIHATTFLSVDDDNQIVGTIQLRHSLTPDLELHAGHIGYAIRPSRRGQGWGRTQLLLVPGEAHALSLPRVLITCDRGNTPSARTAMACGGVLADEVPWKDGILLRYWIELGSAQGR